MSTRIQVERGKSATLEQTFYVDGTATSADGAVTVTLIRADGTAFVTDAATTNPSTGVYRYVLAPQSDLDQFTVVWTGTWSSVEQTETSYVDLVGDFYVTLAELRALPNLSDTAKFTNDELITARQWFEETFEDFTGVAWVPRFRRIALHGTGSDTLLLPDMYPRTLRDVRYYTTYDTYTAYDAAAVAAVAVESSGLLRQWTSTFYRGANNYVVSYEYGLDAPPADVREAAKVAIRDRLLGDNAGNRVYAVSTQDGIVRSSTPGPNTPFGIQSVDEVAVRRRQRVPAVA